MKYGGRGLRSGEEGFTMVELLVSILVSMIVLAAISAAFILQNKSYAKQEQVVNVQENARAALQLMTKELLMAGYDPAGLAKPGVVIGIMMADSDTVRFTMDLEGDTPGSVPDGYVDDSNEDITYALDTTENQVTRKSPNTGTAQPIGESIQSLSFKYFDSDDNELTGVPLSSSDMEEVTRVSVELEPLFPQALSFDVRGGGTYRDFIRLAHAGAAGVCEVAARVLSPSYAFAGPRPLKDSVKPPNLGKRGAKGDMANDETWDNDSSSSDTDSSSSS